MWWIAEGKNDAVQCDCFLGLLSEFYEGDNDVIDQQCDIRQSIAHDGRIVL